MSALNPTSRSQGSSGVETTPILPPTPGGPEAPLEAPDAPRQGELPQAQRRARPSLLRGAVLTATAAVMLAASMPLMNGCALADTDPVGTQVEQVAEARPVRGQVVSAPDTGGIESFWMTPLRGQAGLEVQGRSVQRLWLGAVGSPQTAGLQAGLLGDIDLGRATLEIAATADGLVAYARFPADAQVMDAATIGLPRDVSGTIRLGAAPGAEGGADADHLYLQLGEDAAVYLNGQRFTDVVHLGAASDPALQALHPGQQTELGGRLRSVDTPHGPLAQVASVVSLATAAHEADPVVPPFMKEGVFYSNEEVALPVLTLSSDGVQSDVLVLDETAGRAFRAGLTDGGATLKGVIGDYALTRHHAGGPAFELVDGAPTLDGRALERLGPEAADDAADKQSGWYRDATSGGVFHLSFGIADAQVRAAMSFTAP